MIEKIKDILPEKINPNKAVERLSKTQNGALFVVFICVFIILITIIITLSLYTNAALKKEKHQDHVECYEEIKELKILFDNKQNISKRENDSLRAINERLRDTVVEYRLLQRFNLQYGQKEIIITPKKKKNEK